MKENFKILPSVSPSSHLHTLAAAGTHPHPCELKMSSAHVSEKDTTRASLIFMIVLHLSSSLDTDELKRAICSSAKAPPRCSSYEIRKEVIAFSAKLLEMSNSKTLLLYPKM